MAFQSEKRISWLKRVTTNSVGVMASRLGLSPHTVHTYRERLYRKLGVDSFCQVMSVVFATYVALEREPEWLSPRTKSTDEKDPTPVRGKDHAVPASDNSCADTSVDWKSLAIT